MTTTQVNYLMEKLDKIADDVSDVKERVTRLEATASNLKWMVASMIAGTPVAFLVFDRIVS